MADGGEVSVKVKLQPDISGGVQSRQELEKIRQKAKEVNAEAKGGFERVGEAVGKASRAAGMFQKVLHGFGVAGAITGVSAVIEKIRSSFKAAQKEAENFDKAARAEAVKAGIDALAASYTALGESISAANAARESSGELDDIELKNKRDLEDANLALAEQRELAGVDETDPAAAEIRAGIQARYAARRGEIAAARGVENGEIERGRLRAEAQADRAAAAGIDDEAAKTAAAIEDAKKRRTDAMKRAVSDNDEDYSSFGGYAWGNFKNIMTLNWGRVGDNRTEAGDAARAEARQEADTEHERVKELEKRLEEQRKRADALRTEAEHKEAKADALEGSVAAQRVRHEAVQMQGSASVAAADRAIEKKDKEAAEKEAQYSDATVAAELLLREKAALQQRIAEEQAKKDAANLDVFHAQGAFDMARLGGGAAAQQSAYSGLQAAQEAALGVNHAADDAINALTQTLKSVEQRLKAAQNYLERESKQQRNAWDEAPSA